MPRRFGAPAGWVAALLLLAACGASPSGTASPASPTVTTTPPTASPSPVSPGAATWKTYTSAQEHLTFSYPPDWTLKVVASGNSSGPPVAPGGDAVTLTSPAGSEVSWISATSGLGGGCSPGDAPNVVVVSIAPHPHLTGDYIVVTTQGTVGRQVAIWSPSSGEAVPPPGDTGQCNEHYDSFASRDGTRAMWLRAGGVPQPEAGNLAKSDESTVMAILQSATY